MQARATRSRPSGEDFFQEGISAPPSGPGPVYLARATLAIDRRQFDYIFEGRHYEIDYEGAAILDIGAHKGYFAAYALSRGAAAITSFEPESQNFRFLSESARRARRRGLRWEARKEAIGAAAGEADLLVGVESWSHSLVVSPHPGLAEGRRERVQVVALEPLLTAYRSRRLIVKLNVEGAECDIVLGTPVTAWRHAAVQMWSSTHGHRARLPQSRLISQPRGFCSSAQRVRPIRCFTSGVIRWRCRFNARFCSVLARLAVFVASGAPPGFLAGARPGR